MCIHALMCIHICFGASHCLLYFCWPFKEFKSISHKLSVSICISDTNYAAKLRMSWERLAITTKQEAEEKVRQNTDSTEVASHFVIQKNQLLIVCSHASGSVSLLCALLRTAQEHQKFSQGPKSLCSNDKVQVTKPQNYCDKGCGHFDSSPLGANEVCVTWCDIE